jgi:hypothetical protein
MINPVLGNVIAIIGGLLIGCFLPNAVALLLARRGTPLYYAYCIGFGLALAFLGLLWLGANLIWLQMKG